jgi:monoamine oxidase
LAPVRELEADVVVVGAGLAGLVAARDVAAAGRSVVVHMDGAVQSGERAAAEVLA